MKLLLKKVFFTTSLLGGLFFSTNGFAQSACCTKGKKASDKVACCSSADQQTSGCSPSACRGAKTKFGEAKVIGDLRLSLIALKADMEKSTNPRFDQRSYDIHGIVGNTDDESLNIIAKEVMLVENAFAEKLNYESLEFSLPENKAKQVKYLSTRIAKLKQLL